MPERTMQGARGARSGGSKPQKKSIKQKALKRKRDDVDIEQLQHAVEELVCITLTCYQRRLAEFQKT